ncbi:Ppx/GppA family phosphatase [Sphingomicrobium astaxanthinifaciens]|uniref:Ppx/GppA family phosphatase n=1 Tax=Sphingomicrobium astaxanthinifaciens TaxID=1227949 RepID=UPI001FCB47C7|nr:Ppx/GppA family phosphatase [Sphingomicrobium astaxanthinifaciens]MCJ7422226.1 Ppx/GppA family phosphatase [Sphingomicrobium astaxanthinifaciens]
MIGDLDFGPVGILDIGSNSVRLVVYGGNARVPSILFNEKVMAGLGRGLGADGAMDEEAMTMALDALQRFKAIAKLMRVKRLRTVATAAVRDASNGPDFLYAVARMGLKPALLSGEEEAVASALGVLSAIPWAKGVVADLGGGSLELAGVARGHVGAVSSEPIGVLRVGDPPDADLIAEKLDHALADGQLARAAKGEGLYLVGGSFRAIAHLDLAASGHPLMIAHQHRIDPGRLPQLSGIVEAWGPDRLKAEAQISSQRIPHLPAAIAILSALVRTLRPDRVIISADGLREGLLYQDLPAEERGHDPLLAAALEVGRRLGRFGDIGALLDQWIAPLFPDDGQHKARLRLATCLLGDIAWNAHPDYRAERAVDLALHGNWVGIDAQGRALIGRALFTAFGGGGDFDPAVATLLSERNIARAEGWGRAIRLAMRLSGGIETVLRQSSIARAGKRLALRLPEAQARLYGPAVRKRHDQLAAALDLEAGLELA